MRFPWWWLVAAVGLVLVAGGAVVSARLIKRFEGLRLTVYQDEAGLWTIGYGHLVRPEDAIYPYGTTRTITLARAEQLLAGDMAAAVSAVDRLVHRPLTENQRAALVSLVFNIGVNAFAKSTLLRKLNAGDAPGAAEEFDRWVHAGGQVSNGLVARRAEERALFETA